MVNLPTALGLSDNDTVPGVPFKAVKSVVFLNTTYDQLSPLGAVIFKVKLAAAKSCPVVAVTFQM